MANIMEMAAEIIAAHASTTPMSKDELIAELNEVHAALSALEKGEAVEAAEAEATEEAPAVSRKKAFGKDKIYCMICGKGFKTLSRHLKTSHDMTANEYRKQFDIPRSQSLAAKNYSESRRQMAVDRGLADNLAKARAAKKKK
ncbi:transcriptional regulator, MucR family [Malonomonas rubra DSM 5091]|uniref:Transcriptional regulator, MucR family n=1 Tax=Malonomonas rubra DSM 5091 TaxID=1122189 RepID=A0A1M6BYF3_MALRU|nr:MucR family transcriptional regulator [Malonomonas rubra]SHI53478.1 transcriptional regulator, MucR family [Malonomonas rubra DSM 5091]